MDDGWRQATEGWERLRWARSLRFDSAKAASDSLGMNEHTYRAYERRPDSSKHIPLEHQAAVRFGRKFGVRWQWLLIGNGTPFDEHGGDRVLPASPEDRVVVAIRSVPRDQQERIAAAVEALVKVEGGKG